MDNPYASPEAVAERDHAAPLLTPERERYALLGEAFVAWEQLRVWYNVVLACVALAVVMIFDRGLFLRLDSLEAMVLAALGANACFCAGPLLEGYVTWWIGPLPWLRKVVFIVGTLGAIFLTFIVIAALSYSNAMEGFN